MVIGYRLLVIENDNQSLKEKYYLSRRAERIVYWFTVYGLLFIG
jgi:hypothetical protein